MVAIKRSIVETSCITPFIRQKLTECIPKKRNGNWKHQEHEKKHHVQQRLPSAPPVLSTLVFSEGT